MNLAVVATFGALGAVARFTVDGTIRSRMPSTTPWATILINVSGSFLLGLVTGLVTDHGLSETLRLAVGTGFCGGYTTFSTAMFETVRLIQQSAWRLVAANVVATVVLTTAAAAVGLAVVA